MTTTTCRTGQCLRPIYAKQLCRLHYEQERKARLSPEAKDRSCSHCGTLMRNRTSRRARFCDPTCKEAARTAHRRVTVQATRPERSCLECGTRIPPEAPGHAQVCSRACRIKLQNRKAAASKHARLIVGRAPCKGCGSPVPDDVRAGNVYCSRECRDLTARKLNYDSDRARGYNRRHNYGITNDQFDALLAAQGGKCAICGTSDWPGKGNRPHVDHCHNGGGIRGILCHFCNLGLGNFADDPKRLRKAAEYLER